MKGSRRGLGEIII